MNFTVPNYERSKDGESLMIVGITTYSLDDINSASLILNEGKESLMIEMNILQVTRIDEKGSVIQVPVKLFIRKAEFETHNQFFHYINNENDQFTLSFQEFCALAIYSNYSSTMCSRIYEFFTKLKSQQKRDIEVIKHSIKSNEANKSTVSNDAPRYDRTGRDQSKSGNPTGNDKV